MATMEQLTALRAEIETAHNALVVRVNTSDALVNRIDEGLKKADQNFTEAAIKISALEAALRA